MCSQQRRMSTSCDLRKKYDQTGSVQDTPRTGRPSMLSCHTKKFLYRKARSNPKMEYSTLAEHAVLMNMDSATSKLPSRSTLWRCRKGHGLSNYRCKKRPKMNRGHAAKRLKFCHEHRHFAWGQRTLKFSDECSLQKGSGANQEWCFRFPWEKWKPEMIKAVSTGRAPQQMV